MTAFKIQSILTECLVLKFISTRKFKNVTHDHYYDKVI